MCAVCVRPVRDGAVLRRLPGERDGDADDACDCSGSGRFGGAEYGSTRCTCATGLGPSPLLAFFLGFLPGLGAFYNEQYGKGIIHLAIFLFLFIMGVDGAVSGGAEAALWICIAALWVYMPIVRIARQKRGGRGSGW